MRDNIHSKHGSENAGHKLEGKPSVKIKTNNGRIEENPCSKYLPKKRGLPTIELDLQLTVR
jgi:hypothetical protein